MSEDRLPKQMMTGAPGEKPRISWKKSTDRERWRLGIGRRFVVESYIFTHKGRTFRWVAQYHCNIYITQENLIIQHLSI